MDFNKKNSVCMNTWCKFHSEKLEKCDGEYKEIEKQYILTRHDCPRDIEIHRVVKFEDVYLNHTFYYNKLRLRKIRDGEGRTSEGSILQFTPIQLVTIRD